jgi:Na+-translocating ferredoxin:NAD+ oxidoreductase RnfD subunit
MAVLTLTRPRSRGAFARFWRTPKGEMLLVLLALTAFAAPHTGLSRVLLLIGAALVPALALDAVLVRSLRGCWLFPSGALLSGLFVAVLLDPFVAWYVPALAACVAVASKYLFRTRWSNIFNPAALALVWSALFLSSGESWWGALADLPLVWIVALLATGLWVVSRINKLPMVLTFGAVYFLIFTTAAFLGDTARVAEIFRAPDLHAALFFAFFMLTDPPTSPTRYRDQIWFGVLVAATSAACFLVFGSVYFLLAGLLVGNLWETWRRLRLPGRAVVAPA